MGQEQEKRLDEERNDQMESTAEERHHHSHHHHSHKRQSGKHHKSSRRRSKTKRLIKEKKHFVINVVVIVLAILVVVAVCMIKFPEQGDKTKGSDTDKTGGNGAQTTTSSIQMEVPYFANEVCLIHSSARGFTNANVTVSVVQLAEQYKEKGIRLDVGIPVKISFSATGIPVGCSVINTTVEISENADFADVRSFTLKDGEQSVDVYHLKTGMQYHYRIRLTLSDKSVTSVQGSFQTADTPRILSIEGIVNVRDIGGWKTTDGRIVQQGLLYRGSELDGAVNPAYKLTGKGLSDMLTVLGIRTDMDLRAENEIPQKSSALGANVKYMNYPISMYENVFKENNREKMRQIFAELADPKSYPIYMHCTYGVDRTGTICYLLEALLGVSEQDLIREYRLSALYHETISEEQMKAFTDTLNGIQGETVQEKAENYLLSIGVTAEEIAAIREIFLS